MYGCYIIFLIFYFQLKVNEICHNKNIKFLSGCVFGFYGYMFSDLCKHQFVE